MNETVTCFFIPGSVSKAGFMKKTSNNSEKVTLAWPLWQESKCCFKMTAMANQ